MNKLFNQIAIGPVAFSAFLLSLSLMISLVNIFYNDIKEDDIIKVEEQRFYTNIPEEIVCDLIPYTFVINNFQQTFYNIECKEVLK